ncbi:MAG: hypothetical protein WC792_05505 [Candidatus Micrarchaeia archaeon]|jgi:hypothetical protein
MRRGYFFAIESLLGLLLLTLVLTQARGAAANLDKSAFGKLAQYQALEDLLEVGVRNYGKEFEGLSRGDGRSRELLIEKYETLAPRLGDFCLKISAGDCDSCKLEVNCGGRSGNAAAHALAAQRLLYNGKDFFEVNAALIG